MAERSSFLEMGNTFLPRHGATNQQHHAPGVRDPGSVEDNAAAHRSRIIFSTDSSVTHFPSVLLEVEVRASKEVTWGLLGKILEPK